MQKDKLIYLISTGLLCLFMIVICFSYIFNTAKNIAEITQLGYPAYIIYPLAITKILAVIAIIVNRSYTLKQWAYAGLFFNFCLAILAHLQINDGAYWGALVALILLIVSFIFDQRLRAAKLA